MQRAARRRAAIAALIAALALPAPRAAAVIVRLPAASGPEPGPALTHLAVIVGLSGVYLGDGWVLTAAHVLKAARDQKRTDVTIGGRPFALRPDTAKSLRANDVPSDLALVRIDGDPGLPRLPIARSTPAVGADLVLAGNGPLQESQRGCWKTTGQPVAGPGPGVLCGYAWRKTAEGKTNGIEWGTNQVAAVGQTAPGPGGTRTRSFVTRFRDENATPREAQAGVGDSGGPVIAREDGAPVLAGIMIGVAARSGAAALFGDQTFIADVASHRDEILRIIEAPAAGAR